MRVAFVSPVVYSTSVEGPEGAEHWSVHLVRKLPAHREAIRSLVQVNGKSQSQGHPGLW